MLEVLDRGLVAHVGVSTPDGPVVLPMAYGRGDGHLFLHGAAGNALLRHAIDADVCVTVTIVDGLVIARSPFRNSMNYRSVVVRGVAEVLTGDDQRDALQVITDHVVENWATGRSPTDEEIGRTLVLRVPLTEMSGKIRTGDPTDEADDLTGPHWAGHVAILSTWAQPMDASDLVGAPDPPPAIAALAGQPVYED
jgi:nitroimidazol reductase NimA-like FMN-containing flavoprotein (pyridoxamine 5'-phosphate oxidase superfamily)